MAGRALVVDDDEAVRFLTATGLIQAGWQVYEADSGEAALSSLEKMSCDIIILDLGMPGMNGIAVMRQVNVHWPNVMVIIMTAFASLSSAIEAVRLGAFDYLQKPCTIEEIVSCANRALAEKEELDRQRQLARWAESKPALELSATVPAKSTIRSGELVIELGSHMVSVGGERLLLTPTEYELLKIMAKALGQPIMVERLVQEGLGYNPKDPQALETLRVHISRLRRKVGSDYILTIRGGGYALAYIPVT